MKTIKSQQEILLPTNTTFCKRYWCRKDISESNSKSSQNEQIEEACWNGMLPEIFPEIIEGPRLGSKLFLWHIRSGRSFLQIELSEFPVFVEKHCSIDTTFFLPTLINN
jgi:hypothetical protein